MAIFFWLMLMLLPVGGMITATGLVGMLLTRKSVHNPQLFRGMKHFTFWGLGLLAVSGALYLLTIIFSR